MITQRIAINSVSMQYYNKYIYLKKKIILTLPFALESEIHTDFWQRPVTVIALLKFYEICKLTWSVNSCFIIDTRQSYKPEIEGY